MIVQQELKSDETISEHLTQEQPSQDDQVITKSPNTLREYEEEYLKKQNDFDAIEESSEEEASSDSSADNPDEEEEENTVKIKQCESDVDYVPTIRRRGRGVKRRTIPSSEDTPESNDVIMNTDESKASKESAKSG